MIRSIRVEIVIVTVTVLLGRRRRWRKSRSDEIFLGQRKR
jgi:hypothetical protein